MKKPNDPILSPSACIASMKGFNESVFLLLSTCNNIIPRLAMDAEIKKILISAMHEVDKYYNTNA